jgi:hypothetical protein
MDENEGMEGHVIQGLDVLDVLGFISKKQKRFLAIGLNELEEIFRIHDIKNLNELEKICKELELERDSEEFQVLEKLILLDRDSEEFQLVRKLILDLVNEYTRSILRVIFGDIETLKYKEPKKEEPRVYE